MTDIKIIRQYLGNLQESLLREIALHSKTVKVDANTVLLNEGQAVKEIPIVLNGLIKVISRFEDKEAGLKSTTSKVVAITEKETELLLIPAIKMQEWVNIFPEINKLYYNLYDLRYSDMLETMQQLVYNKMDERVMDFIRTRVKIEKSNAIKLLHREIAQALGSSREVVTRTLHKLEREKKIKIDSEGAILLL
ncbi:MAG: Crp/Fnr family transcriptional regulator [Cyclobacteriaceae bacterium]|nr:Crp/Fnr family transcriptional regulator [Cyclobacteriaceae bacterium]